MYYAKPGDFKLPLGDGLGQLTNELAEGEFIVEGVFNGPKNYAYKTNFNRMKSIVKGFSINHETSEKLNFQSLKDVCLHDRTKKIGVKQLKFTRNKNTWNVQTSMVEKIYSFVYDKRVMVSDYKTLPFGY